MSFTRYKLVLRLPAGVKLAEVADYDELAYTKLVNGPGSLRVVLRGNHPALAGVGDLVQVTLLRALPDVGVGWYVELDTLCRAIGRRVRDTTVVTLTGVGVLSMLGWRTLAYASGVADRTRFSATQAGAIMHRMVRWNATADATTANGRLLNGPVQLPGGGNAITVPGSEPAVGTLRDWNCAQDNLLASLQELARVGGCDFDLIRSGPASWQFQVFGGQRGSDRSSSVVFSLGNGTMTDVDWRFDAANAATVAIVGGPGEETARLFDVRTGNGFSGSNQMEVFVDARSDNDAAARQARGDLALHKARPVQTLNYRVLQTAAIRYGRDYQVGDLIGDRVFGVTGVRKVVGVAVAHRREGEEQIDVEVASG